jgi:hypothetical protein
MQVYVQAVYVQAVYVQGKIDLQMKKPVKSIKNGKECVEQIKSVQLCQRRQYSEGSDRNGTDLVVGKAPGFASAPVTLPASCVGQDWLTSRVLGTDHTQSITRHAHQLVYGQSGESGQSIK